MKSLILVLALTIPLLGAADAATVEFLNGDRLTGEPAGVESGRLRLVTELCGVVLVDVAAIASIDGAAPELESLVFRF